MNMSEFDVTKMVECNSDNELTADIIADYESMLEDGDDIMLLETFIESVNDGFFNDDDGQGYYVDKNNKITNISCDPSDIICGNILYDYPKMVWYNK